MIYIVGVEVIAVKFRIRKLIKLNKTYTMCISSINRNTESHWACVYLKAHDFRLKED